MIREYCECGTSTRPRVGKDGTCPNCGLGRRSSKSKANRRGRERQYERIARYVYDTDRDVELPEEGTERETP